MKFPPLDHEFGRGKLRLGSREGGHRAKGVAILRGWSRIRVPGGNRCGGLLEGRTTTGDQKAEATLRPFRLGEAGQHLRRPGNEIARAQPRHHAPLLVGERHDPFQSALSAVDGVRRRRVAPRRSGDTRLPTRQV